ncbi:hypothetical protein HLPR_20570 [Helicovermis profundi]|uniref:Uncharacterized protein n=1 Tax=Helicovermis profundi TaxID=3065157 RepID=A0AAU9E501_9FIRM|nr:hypothetical protein HLPR_20570 [Clostridia bacterium S502]
MVEKNYSPEAFLLAFIIKNVLDINSIGIPVCYLIPYLAIKYYSIIREEVVPIELNTLS